MERARRRLERQRQLAQEKLLEEQEKEELERIEREIQDLNNKRLVQNASHLNSKKTRSNLNLNKVDTTIVKHQPSKPVNRKTLTKPIVKTRGETCQSKHDKHTIPAA